MWHHEDQTAWLRTIRERFRVVWDSYLLKTPTKRFVADTRHKNLQLHQQEAIH